MSTKAEAYRWLDHHVGDDITTRQRYPDGRCWEPGVRTLGKRGQRAWTLDGSEVRLSSTHVVLDVTDDLLLLEWQDEDGTQIHVTAYRVVWPEVDDEDAFDID